MGFETPATQYQAPRPATHRLQGQTNSIVMSRPRKSKIPVDVPVPTPASPVELLQNLTTLPPGDPRALVVSSTAVALSVASAFHDTRDISSDGSTARGRDAGWQTAYGAARMAIEITKESSDLFLPLKAVTGAISVLIKNYDVGVLCY